MPAHDDGVSDYYSATSRRLPLLKSEIAVIHRLCLWVKAGRPGLSIDGLRELKLWPLGRKTVSFFLLKVVLLQVMSESKSI